MTQTEETVTQIAERLRFFFSIPNLRSDRYLQRELLLEADYGGSISAEKLLNFKSIRQHTTDEAIVIEAAKTLPNLLVVSDKNISCKEPLKKSQLDDNIPLSLHVSNLPVKDGKYVVGVKDLKPIFEKYGTVTLIRLKWKPERPSNDENKERDQRKGRKMIPAASCSVEFEKVEELEKALEDLLKENSNEKNGLEIKGEKVEIMRLRDWIDARKNKKRGREKGPTDNVKSESNNNGAKMEKNKKKSESTPVQFSIDWKPGCVIELKGLDTKNCDREAIRAIANFDNNNTYADYSRGQNEGAIRFSEPSDEIQKLAEKLNSGEIKIAGSIVGSARVLADEEEQTYWKKFIDFKTKNLQHQQQENSKKKRRFNKK